MFSVYLSILTIFISCLRYISEEGLSKQMVLWDIMEDLISSIFEIQSPLTISIYSFIFKHPMLGSSIIVIFF